LTAARWGTTTVVTTAELMGQMKVALTAGLMAVRWGSTTAVTTAVVKDSYWAEPMACSSVGTTDEKSAEMRVVPTVSQKADTLVYLMAATMVVDSADLWADPSVVDSADLWAGPSAAE
jgi:hypothetical protein